MNLHNHRAPSSSNLERARTATFAVMRRSGELAKRFPGCAPLVSGVSRHLTHREIRRLHDALDPTPIAGRYWIVGGLLLGWARQGDLLAHDTADVDFAFRSADYGRLRESIPFLVAAGFQLSHAWRDNDGELTALTFLRSGVHFDFLKMTPVEDRLRYRCYFLGVQVTGELPSQPLVPFELFGRTWLKPADHERELAAAYGDWWNPRTDWRTDRDSPSVTSREAHNAPDADASDLSEFLLTTRSGGRPGGDLAAGGDPTGPPGGS